MGYQQPLKSSGYAVTSLVLGIASIPTCFCLGLPAIICGILAVVFHKNAMRDIDAGVVSASSAGMAKAGRILGGLHWCDSGRQGLLSRPADGPARVRTN